MSESSISRVTPLASRKGTKNTKANPSEVLTKIDAIEKLIEDIPAEHLADVQTAVSRIFADRMCTERVTSTHVNPLA
jgi:hypothetical protein